MFPLFGTILIETRFKSETIAQNHFGSILNLNNFQKTGIHSDS